MKRTPVLAALIVALLPFATQAHKAWLLPSETTTTVDQWVTVDGAVSNDLFYFNHVPLRLENLTITAPDGSTVQPENSSTGKYRSTFDVPLKQAGTYCIGTLNSGLFASYDDNGATKRWRGTAEKFATEVPADAKNLQVTESLGRVETYVTAGKPDTKVLQPSGTGIEFVPVTHPNDLYTGEAAEFRFLVDGKPAANLPVTIIAGGSRYRNQPEEIDVKTDAKGSFSVTWPHPGMYWLEASLQDEKTTLKQAKQRRLSYAATFEVLQQ